MSAPSRVLTAALVTIALDSSSLAAQVTGHSAHGASRAAAAPGAKGYYSFGFRPGERVADVTVVDIGGRVSPLAELSGSKGAVIVIRDTECPVTQRYSPRLAELEQEYGPQGYTFSYVDVTPHSRDEAKADAAKYGLHGRTILDADHKAVNALRAGSAAEAFVIDAGGTLRYRGAIDDQYGIDFHREAPMMNYLRESLARVSSGREIVRRQTDAPGCVLSTDQVANGSERAVTYHNRINRLVAENCQSCHRAEGNAPMPLDTYKQVSERRATIEYMTKSGRMPPWFAHRKVGEWANDRSLSERALKDLLTWAHNGAPARGVACKAGQSRAKDWCAVGARPCEWRRCWRCSRLPQGLSRRCPIRCERWMARRCASAQASCPPWSPSSRHGARRVVASSPSWIRCTTR